MSSPPDHPHDDAPGSPRRSLWLLWTAFTAPVVLAAIVIPLVGADPDSTVPAALPAVLALAAGVAALAGVEALDRGLLRRVPDDDAAAVAELRTLLAGQAAIAEGPALLAVAMAFVLGPPWVAAVGAAPVLVAFARVAPSAARLARFDAAWQASGGEASLRRALLPRP